MNDFEPSLHRLKEVLERLNEKKVSNPYASVNKVKEEVDFQLQAPIGSSNDLISLLQQAVAYSPKTSHEMFLNYFYSAPDDIGLLADWVISAINNNVHAYEAAPYFSVIEQETVHFLSEKVGFTKGDGVFCPGGSYSNMLSMFLARKKHNSPIHKLALFVSEEAHYSIDKARDLVGIPAENVYKIRCDSGGKMLLKELENAIKHSKEQDQVPFFVCATAGTTVLGAFDPIKEIVEVVKQHSTAWVHVDAAWGGAVLFSDKYNHLIQGVNQADSVTLDFHKALSAPLLCSCLLIKEKDNFSFLTDVHSTYLFHEESPSSCNLGEKTLQCGREADSFKFWLMWKVKGESFFTDKVNHMFRMAKEATKQLNKHKNMLLVQKKPAYLNICFWCIPNGLEKKSSIEEYNHTEKQLIEKNTRRIRNKLMKEGDIHLNYSTSQQKPAFFRLITANSKLTKESIKTLINKINQINVYSGRAN